MIDSIPEGYRATKPAGCDGAIDVVNGISPPPLTTNTSGLLSVGGWLAVSGKHGIVADDIFVTLSNPGEATRYIMTRRTPRNDVNEHFHQPAMPDVGYVTIADVSSLNGEYMLGLARGYKGRLEQCVQFNVPINIRGMK